MINSVSKPLQLSIDDYFLLVEVFSTYELATDYHIHDFDSDQVRDLRNRLLDACFGSALSNLEVYKGGTKK